MKREAVNPPAAGDRAPTQSLDAQMPDAKLRRDREVRDSLTARRGMAVIDPAARPG
jgi:hypothetical protein